MKSLEEKILTNNNIEQTRIDKLEEILLRLHHGATPESVQDDFNEHFTGVSAVEISMMEHQLIFGDSEITFEDVLQLCNVHANLFKETITDGSATDIDLPGHPVQVFKEENMALRSTLMRINNLLDKLADMSPEELADGMLKGLRRQYDLLGQFDIHYERKEKIFFPKMEMYGHDAPSKVMWGKDDEIRDLFKTAYKTMEALPEVGFAKAKETFAAFEFEFNEMIFKEEAILLNILIESLKVEDWYDIAQESDAYGYAIVRPNQKWEPDFIKDLQEEKIEEEVQHLNLDPNIPTNTHSIQSQKISLPQGDLVISWEANSQSKQANPNNISRQTNFQLGDGLLSLDYIDLLMQYSPVEITMVNPQDIVQYSNYIPEWENNFSSRNYVTLGRSTETIYSKNLKAEAMSIISRLKSKESVKESLRHTDGQSHYQIDWLALYDGLGNYQGFVEIIHKLDYFRSIQEKVKRKLVPLEDVKLKAVKLSPKLTIQDSQSRSQVSELATHKLSFNEGNLLLSWEDIEHAVSDFEELNRFVPVDFLGGQLTLDQVHTIMNSLPYEVTFVDDQDLFQYFNNIVPYADMIFKRTPAQVSRNLELCHPPYLWPMVSELMADLKAQRRHTEELWYQAGPEGPFVHIFYQAMYDSKGNYRGILETVQDISPYLD